MHRPLLACLVAAALVTASVQSVQAEEAANVEAEAEKAFVPPPGFKERTKNGQTVYCRARAPVGTKIKNWECYSQAELTQVSESMRRSAEELKQRGRMCDRGQMCTGG